MSTKSINENPWHLAFFIPWQMTTTACRLGTRFHSLSVRPPLLPGDGIPSIAPIEGVDLDSLSDMSETDRAKAMFNQLKQVKAGNVWGMKLRLCESRL